MLATRGTLYSLFGLDAPILLDVLAIGLLAYAGVLAFAARRRSVGRQTLMAFTIADAIWVGASAIVLLVFWGQLAPLARVLVIAAAIVVEAFATLQFRAARRTTGGSPQIA
jgi:CHASE2 domain-containing sensor protein